MSKFGLIVVGADPELQMRPFLEDEFNANSKFDTYQLGGRFYGYLVLKVNAPAGRDREDRPTRFVNRAFHRDVDWDATKAQALAASSRYELFAILNQGVWSQHAQISWRSNSPNVPGDQWRRAFDRVIEGLLPDDVITIFDCHA